MIWQNDRRDYFAYMCTNKACPRYAAEWRNQDDDPACQHCREGRKRLGHFESMGKDNNVYRRRNVETGKVQARQRHNTTAGLSGWVGLSADDTVGQRDGRGFVVG